jgi:hypothetical protein
LFVHTGETKQAEQKLHFLSALPCGRWVKTTWGAVQIVSTPYGKGVRTGPNFYCGREKTVCCFGPVSIVHEDDYDADRKGPWFGYGVYWGSRQVAIPACAPSALAHVGPLVNTACSELEETNNLRLGSGRIGNSPTVNLVSTRVIRCNEMLLVDYGRSEALRLKQTRVKVTAVAKKIARAKLGKRPACRLVCKKCFRAYEYRKQAAHFASECKPSKKKK